MGSIGASSGPEQTETRPMEGERKLVTALIVDISGSVALVSALDPEHAHRIVHAVLRTMIDSVRQFEGHVLQPTGDGIYAVFGVPRAVQDHASRAVHAALEMQKRLRTLAENRRPGEPLIEVRAGIESGEVVLRDLDLGQGSVPITVGHTVNLAARLQSVAPPGSVVIGKQTHDLVVGYFDVRPLPPAMVKGVSHPIEIYEVIGLGNLRRHSQVSGRRALTPFVGRERELRTLQDALLRAEGGQGQLVVISAGPGVGKSRLLLEFRQTIPLGHRTIEAHGVSYARTTPWLPVIGMLRAYFEIADSDDPTARRTKVEAALNPLRLDVDDVRPILFGLLGIVDGPDPLRQMDPLVRRDRIIEAIIRIVLAESRSQPVVLIFEDLHWTDDQTRLLLRRLTDRVADGRILVLASYRPEFPLDWPISDHVTEITLGPLDHDDADHMLSSLLDASADVTELKQMIVDRTGGNPFFMEETINSLFQDGTLTRGAEVRMTRQVGDLNVPMTVRGVLLERIDQMGARRKELLQILSVIGRVVAVKLVLLVAPWARADTLAMVHDLRDADLIHVQAPVGPADEKPTYTFKHALTQEVAYQTMLLDQQRDWHQRVAQTIESTPGASLDDQIALLAHHYEAAANHPKAIEYLGKAGQQAIQRAAHGEAIGFFRKALQLAELAPDETIAARAVLWSSLRTSLLVTNGYSHPDVRQAYHHARELCTALGDKANLTLVLRGIFLIHISSAEYPAALRTGRELLELGGEDQAALLEGEVILGVTSIYVGELQASNAWFEQAISRSLNNQGAGKFQHTGHTYTLCRAYHAICCTYLGRIDQSLEESLDAQRASEAIAVPITTAQTLAARGTNLHRLRYHDEAVACYDIAIECSTRHGIPYWAAFCIMAKAAIVADRDDFDAALATFDEARADYQRPGARLIMSWFLYLRADMLARVGRIQEALTTIDETIAFIAETGEIVFEPEVYRLKGSIIARLPDDARAGRLAEAEAFFDRALNAARRLHATLWELRAATGLASLLASQHRFADARALLGPVYGSFTEGFSSPDLIDAQRLLHYLAADGHDALSTTGVEVAVSALLPL
jgi:class 3 adenylate cyclase/tetratricopeptide (TPR) repeat protein